MVMKPIWCKCERHSWTRRQLYSAWERDRSLRCPDCDREVPLEAIEELLIRLGMVTDESPIDETTGG